jgi:hypothetical protein
MLRFARNDKEGKKRLFVYHTKLALHLIREQWSRDFVKISRGPSSVIPAYAGIQGKQLQSYNYYLR